jgi:hypothetical protein
LTLSNTFHFLRLNIIKVFFYSPTDAQVSCLKNQNFNVNFDIVF